MRTLALPALLVVLPLAATAPATAKPTRPANPARPAKPARPAYERFWVTFKAHQNTTWDQPKHMAGENCYTRQWHEASGSERWTIATRVRRRALAIVTAGPAITFRIGTWRPTEHVKNPYVRLLSRVERARRERSWVEPGRCGGSSKELQLPPHDCGVRRHGLKSSFEIALDAKFRFQLGGDPPGQKRLFEHCPMLYPSEIAELSIEDPAVPGKAAEFADRGREVVTLGWRGTFEEKAPAGGRATETLTDAAWEFTFRRVGAKKPGR